MSQVNSTASTIHIMAGQEGHTTGRYFERAIAQSGRYAWRAWDHSSERQLGRDDVVLYVDPGPPRLPLGIESFPCRTVCYLIDVHQHLQSRLEIGALFDTVFIAQKDYIDAFEAQGIRARWLPLGCEPLTHFVPGLKRDIDVGFVGQLGNAGTRRREVLAKVLGEFRTNDYSRFHSPTEMGGVYSRSKIVFNVSINGDVNMRVFEAMAAGALLVTDRIGNGLSELFEEGRHYIGYDSAEEAIHLIGKYLQDESGRSRISMEGQAEVLARHTYECRATQLLQTGRMASPASRPAAGFGNDRLAELYASLLVMRYDWKRMPSVAMRYGNVQKIVWPFTRAVGRTINRRVPITPNALRFYLRSRKSA